MDFPLRQKSKTQIYRLVLLPIELKNREFHSHILLASSLVQKGYRVILGSHAAIFSYLRSMHSDEFGGVYLDKSTQILEVSEFISARVSTMLILDQELSPIQNRLGVFSKRNVVQERIYKNTERFVDGFFTVGPAITSSANEVLPSRKVIETGWPRFELLEHHAENIYSSEIMKIRGEFGDFCLFVSSFSLVQSIERCRTLEPIEKLGWITETFNEEWWRHQYSQLDLFLETLRMWRKMGFTQKVVIRPHLYEDLKSWRELVKNIPQVEVVKKGEISSWLHAASSVLHRGSTVSIQSALLKKPTYSLPECTPLEYSLSLQFSTPVGMSVAPSLSLNADQVNNQTVMLSDLIKNLGSGSPSKDIADYIESLEIPETKPVRKFRIYWTYVSNLKSLRRGLGLIKDEIRRACKLDVGTTVSIAIPWGLRSSEACQVLKGINENICAETKVTQIAVNLIEFTPTNHLS